jgi:hypothetical protein
MLDGRQPLLILVILSSILPGYKKKKENAKNLKIDREQLQWMPCLRSCG